MPTTRRRAAALLGLGLAIGLTTPEASAEENPVAPDRVKAIIPDLRALIETLQPAYGIPGLAIGLFNRQGIIWAEGFGRRRVDRPEAPDLDTLFEIGSATKPMLSTTLAMAVAEGRLGWDDRVTDHIPGFRLPEAWVTQEFRISDLMRQYSGLRPYGMDFTWGLGALPEAVLKALAVAPWTGGFRARFQYVNTLHVVTGALLARIYGVTDWSDLAAQRLFRPLGMTRTMVTAAAWRADGNIAQPHAWRDGKALPMGPITDQAQGAGAVKSSIADLRHWIAFQLGGGVFQGKRLVAEAALTATHTGAVPMTPTMNYAMGWAIMRTPRGSAISHNGGTGGSNAHIGLLEGQDFGVAILTNLSPRGLPDALATWIYYRLLGADLPDNLRAPLAGPTPDPAPRIAPTVPMVRPASAYEGRYDQEFLGPADVTAGGAGLVLQFRDRPFAVDLRPVGGDVFAATLLQSPAVPGELAEVTTTTVQFEPAPEGYEVATIRTTDPASPLVFTRAAKT